MAEHLAHAHEARFYEVVDELVDPVARFLSDGLRAGDLIAVLAPTAHAELYRDAIESLGHSRSELETGSVVLEANAALDRVVHGTDVDKDAFAAIVDPLVARAAAEHRRLRVVGELVDILCQRGAPRVAVELEDEWNERIARGGLSLWCSYNMAGVARGDDLVAAGGVCQSHGAVSPSVANRGFTSAASDDAETPRRWLFLPDRRSVRDVRAFVGHIAKGWTKQPALDDLLLVASELASNVVRHACTPFRVTLERLGAAVRCTVDDLDTRGPAARPLAEDAPDGRGMHLVTEIARDWGWAPLPVGKRVWADVAA